MAGKRNFLLGHGERLTEPVIVRTGGPDKVPPYTVSESKRRLAPMIRRAVTAFDALPDVACPGGKVVGTLTLNPEYIAKSYYPGELLKTVGLQALGSRPRRITPEKRSKERPPEESLTTQLYVAGSKQAFRAWAEGLASWPEGTKPAESLVSIEEVSAPLFSEKIKGTIPTSKNATFEVVLHADETSGEEQAVNQFRRYLKHLGLDNRLSSRFYARGLCFIELEAPVSLANDIATYTMVRALRQMPALRVLRPTIRGATMPSQSLVLPSGPAVDQDTVAAIFDGGIPSGHPISPWARSIDPSGIGPPVPAYIEHGVGVTSAFLFGHIDPASAIPQPYCKVDHYRVLDAQPGQDPRELYEVLHRIKDTLLRKRYPLVNISLGPILSVEDDDVHAWTAVLDELLSDGKTLATVAVGNTGESDAEAGLNRIQVPSDCVNALAVGACDSPDEKWQRAPYSSVGPGRSPGLIKPDMVDFGGSMPRPFLVLGPSSAVALSPTGGTSYAAPSVLRLAAGVRAHFGPEISMLTVRALLIHSCESSDLPKHEIGRGRAARDLEALVICADDEMRVVYQGEITPGKYIRAPIPLPALALEGRVSIRATLCFTTNVDPHHPGNYTQAGLEATYRPHDQRRKTDDQIHADTKSFFGPARKGLTEEELRRDAWKWENTHHAVVNCNGSSLKNPIFDIHYNARDEGHNLASSDALKYALVVTVRAPRVPDLYDRVLRRYATQLAPFRPVIEIPVRT